MRSPRTSAAPTWRFRSSGRRRGGAGWRRVGFGPLKRRCGGVARFRGGGGARNASGVDCPIIDPGHRRARDLALEVPDSPLEAVMSAEVWEQVYQRLAELIA